MQSCLFSKCLQHQQIFLTVIFMFEIRLFRLLLHKTLIFARLLLYTILQLEHCHLQTLPHRLCLQHLLSQCKLLYIFRFLYCSDGLIEHSLYFLMFCHLPQIGSHNLVLNQHHNPPKKTHHRIFHMIKCTKTSCPILHKTIIIILLKYNFILPMLDSLHILSHKSIDPQQTTLLHLQQPLLRRQLINLNHLIHPLINPHILLIDQHKRRDKIQFLLRKRRSDLKHPTIIDIHKGLFRPFLINNSNRKSLLMIVERTNQRKTFSSI